MKRISYAGESFVTTDGVADALLRFVAALGANHTSAAIEIPALTAEYDVQLVQLVAGPASEIISRPEEVLVTTTAAEDSSTAAVERLNASTEALTASHNVVYAHPHGALGFDFEGLESL